MLNILQTCEILCIGLLNLCGQQVNASQLFCFFRYPHINPPLNIQTHLSMMHKARMANLPRIPGNLQEFGVMMAQPDIMSRFGLAEVNIGPALPDQEPAERHSFFRTVLVGNDLEGETAVFASAQMLEALEASQEIHLDGTFKVRLRMSTDSFLIQQSAIFFFHLMIFSLNLYHASYWQHNSSYRA